MPSWSAQSSAMRTEVEPMYLAKFWIHCPSKSQMRPPPPASRWGFAALHAAQVREQAPLEDQGLLFGLLVRYFAVYVTAASALLYRPEVPLRLLPLPTTQAHWSQPLKTQLTQPNHRTNTQPMNKNPAASLPPLHKPKQNPPIQKQINP